MPAPSPSRESLATDALFPEASLQAIDLILSAIPNPIVAIDEEGVVRLCNEGMGELFPQGKEGILNQPLSDAIKGSRLLHTVQTGLPERWQKLKLGKRSFLVNRSPLEVGGRRIGALASLHEISELEAISSELKSVRLLNEELDGIIDSSFDGIYVTDGEGKTLRVNSAYERITGLSRDEVIGHTMHELVRRNVFDQSATVGVLASGRQTTIIQKIKNGATVMASGTPLRDSRGKIVRVVTTVRDLTELNRLRDELNAAGTLNTRYEEELRALKQQLHDQTGMIVRSASMRTVVDLALRLGAVDSTVLIQGESGVGKEEIAELIHRNSPRHDKPFIKINCTAIPETLLESELFGYARGAFTGAGKDGKRGLFETADGGTLLLDEVGDLPLQLQVKLLRVIQEKQTRRIGDTVSRAIDVRLIAATNQNLPEMVREKRFREDLYYRLNVIPVHIPPLRERKEDIVFMIHAFLQRFCTRHKRARDLHPTVTPLLLEYSWPGNVRELENIMERLVVTSAGEIIMPGDLPVSILGATPASSISLAMQGESLKDILHNVEARILQLAFTQYKTTRKVAKALGIDQSSVVRKAKKLGITVQA